MRFDTGLLFAAWKELLVIRCVETDIGTQQPHRRCFDVNLNGTIRLTRQQRFKRSFVKINSLASRRVELKTWLESASEPR